MIKPVLLTLCLTLLGANAFAASTAPQAQQKYSAASGQVVATIDEDKVMAERLMG